MADLVTVAQSTPKLVTGNLIGIISLVLALISYAPEALLGRQVRTILGLRTSLSGIPLRSRPVYRTLESHLKRIKIIAGVIAICAFITNFVLFSGWFISSTLVLEGIVFLGFAAIVIILFIIQYVLAKQ